jgi:hypothetical protein
MAFWEPGVERGSGELPLTWLVVRGLRRSSPYPDVTRRNGSRNTAFTVAGAEARQFIREYLKSRYTPVYLKGDKVAC